MGKLVNGIIAAIATLFIMAGISMPALAATDDTYVPKNDSAGNIFVQDQANVLSAETEKHVYDLNKSWESREDKPQLLVVTVSTLDGVPIERKGEGTVRPVQTRHERQEHRPRIPAVHQGP